MSAPTARIQDRALIALRRLTVINLVLIWLNASGYLEFAKVDALGPGPFVWATFLIHFLLINALLFTFFWVAAKALPRLITLVIAPFIFAFQQFFYALDQKIFSLFKFHVNGLVMQIIMQPDAAKVLGINVTELLWAGAAVITILALELAGAYLLYRYAKPQTQAKTNSRALVYVVFAVFILAVVDKVTYAVYAYKGDRTVVAQARVIPFYLPISMNKMLGKFLKTNPYASGTVNEAAGSYLRYPKHPITWKSTATTPNIFWINIESWRADSVSAASTPNLWRYREEFSRAGQHYSGGNATRLGMFSLFYGINPSYWDYFLAERKGPVFLDLLQHQNYEFDVLSSASLNFLGTRDTVFRQVKTIRQEFYYRPEVSDAIMLRKALETLDQRTPDQPIFQFQFFDATHARYRFLPGFDPFQPYVKDINGLDENASAQRDLVWNRYLNSVYYVDFLLGRYLDGLKQRGLFDSSIIVITGDHGEEFWEHGHWTHSSAFTEQQLRVPLWIHLPGKPAQDVPRLTSHMDIVPTILEAMGVENPPTDYAQGGSIFGPERPFAIASGWGNYVVIEPDTKISFYATNFSFSLSEVTDRDDRPLTVSNAEIFKQKGPRLMEVFGQFGEFLSGGGK